jgi:hypothetical protein
MPVSFKDLEFAYDFVNMGGMGENQAVLDLQSGRIYCRSELLGDLEEQEEFPDDIDDDERYIGIPHKNELDLGTTLVFDFVRRFLPDAYDEVRDDFRRKGGYRRFKALLARHGATNRWHDFSSKAEETALRQWCADNAIELSD